MLVNINTPFPTDKILFGTFVMKKLKLETNNFVTKSLEVDLAYKKNNVIL